MNKRLPPARVLPGALLVTTAVLLAAGGPVYAFGPSAAAHGLWFAAGCIGAGYSLWTTVGTIRAGSPGVDVIALLALVGALGVGEYLAAAVISVMLTSGRALEAWAAGRARRDLHALLERAPRVARRYEDATLQIVPVEEITPGDRLLVGTGELVPVDGNLLAGAVLDESALTGESLPVERVSGEAVRSGVVNASGPFDMRATASAFESSYSAVIRLVSEAEASRAPFVRLADRWAVWFLAASVAAGAAAWAAGGPGRMVAVLVVATPCPLILAAPVALVAGLSVTARRGVVIKGGGALERLAACTTLLIDKTGTITTGRPALTGVVTAGDMPEDEVVRLAGSLDQVSPHVLAHAVVEAAEARTGQLVLPSAVEEVAGKGIRGLVGDRSVSLGKADWVGVSGFPAWSKAARRRAQLDGSMTVFVSVDDRPAGVLLFDDPVRPDAARTVRSLRQSGIQRIVMVTGDRAEVADGVGAVIGVDDVLADRSPEDKLDAVRAERHRAATVMVGDGINDAPALALADVGVCMGARGATASSETADVVLTVDRLDRLGDARRIALVSKRVALESVTAGMAMSISAMVAAGLGFLPSVWGALLQEFIDMAVILNALKVLRLRSSAVRLGQEESSLSRRFQAEHTAIRAVIERVRSTADALGTLPREEADARIREVYRLLVDVVEPHESAEEKVLYPALDRLLGGDDPTGPMSRGHIEIAHLIRRLGQLLEVVGPEGPDEDEITDIRGLLYGLHAVLRLHTTQEEESYLSLADEAGGVIGQGVVP